MRSTPDFHALTPASQWAVLRAQVMSDTTAAGVALLEIFDSREPRRDAVLQALEEARRAEARRSAQG